MTRLTIRYNRCEQRWEVVTAFGIVEYNAETRLECDVYAITENQRMRDDAPPTEGPRQPMDVKFYGSF